MTVTSQGDGLPACATAVVESTNRNGKFFSAAGNADFYRVFSPLAGFSHDRGPPRGKRFDTWLG
jgi:hypothetical protein